ncbi:hypothetical protein [Nocardioides currus]|uniref:Copper type II ascorbate-dependent monooxygenase N-terminal domain-containing protein n=1 Tax=Nocardioides currus TaxID=2133958 RepID=A0A2R7YVT0_9ACTN|nr:hypothetical protein [Nocardioides currus]PUA80424.1 hypothetical protein C7S10_14985 [Nocardioides currus]
MTRRPNTRLRAAVGAVAALALLATGCQGAADPSADSPTTATENQPAADTSAHTGHDSHAGAKPAKEVPLRAGERRSTLAMPAAYTPSAPYGEGTDDYRCFLLDPGLSGDEWLTGTTVQPGNPDVVHHVILFQVPPEMVEAAKAKDAQEDGEGWTCFGGTGLDAFQNVDDAAWIGAWAPGGEESVRKPGYGVKLRAGSQVVMQVHYNLLAGSSPDTSAAQLRLAPGDRDMQQLHTMLLPAPVELPCRAEHAHGPLCERDAAMMDVLKRFGMEGSSTANALYLLCGGEPEPGQVQSCTRRVNEPMTIHAAGGHMHLLGREIRIETNPGTPRAKTVLDIPVWDFDDQGARDIEPVSLEPGDTVEVTCKHVQWLRDQLPSFEGQPDRYVVWGEGTTDEMCLGMLQVTRP